MNLVRVNERVDEEIGEREESVDFGLLQSQSQKRSLDFEVRRCDFYIRLSSRGWFQSRRTLCNHVINKLIIDIHLRLLRTSHQTSPDNGSRRRQ